MSLFDPTYAPVLPARIFVNHEQRWTETPTLDDDFMDEVKGLLVRIGRTRVGRSVFSALVRGDTIVTPFANQTKDLPPPPFGRTFTTPWSDADATAKLEPLRDHLGQPDPAAGVGTGLGTIAVTYFDVATDWSTRHGAEGTLVHELAHAIRYVWGATRGRPIGSTRLHPKLAFPNSEEFFAMVIQNMYSVEVGRLPNVGYENGGSPGLLAGLKSRPPTGPAGQVRRELWVKHRRQMQNYLRDLVRRAPNMSTVFADFASLNIPYNPFRDMNSPTAPVYVPARFL